MTTPSSNTSSLPGLEKILSCPALPSLPSVALKVLELTGNQNVKLDEIASVVQNDQALATKILKTINSSFYGLAKPCPTISRAVALLGMSTVKSLVLSFSLVDMTRDNKLGIDMDTYWRRNVFSATAARKLALRTRCCDPEEAFLASIMQDVAMLAMDVVMGKVYQAIVASVGPDHNNLVAAEREALQFDHAFVGSKLAEKWRLAPEQVRAIADHHDAHRAISSDNELSKTTIVANAISQVLLAEERGAAMREAERLAQDMFGLDADAVAETVEKTKEDSRDLSRQLLSGASQAPASEEILSRAEEARLQHQITMQREADDLRRAAEKAELKATTDALTKVGNRARLDRELAHHFERAKEIKSSLAVAFIDADRFKALNDTLGHLAGDDVLIELARRFTEALGASGLVCRYGGEEFACILPDTNERCAAEAAERLRRAAADAPVTLDKSCHSVASVNTSVSVGVAVLSPETAHIYSRAELLTLAADKALYAAKHAGRNCVRVFRPRVNGKAVRAVSAAADPPPSAETDIAQRPREANRS